MTAREYGLARLLLTEERVGSRVRAEQRGELSEEQRSQELLRQRGMVSDG